MDKIFTWEQWRMIFATPLSPVLAYLTPTAVVMAVAADVAAAAN